MQKKNNINFSIFLQIVTGAITGISANPPSNFIPLFSREARQFYKGIIRGDCARVCAR